MPLKTSSNRKAETGDDENVVPATNITSVESTKDGKVAAAETASDSNRNDRNELPEELWAALDDLERKFQRRVDDIGLDVANQQNLQQQLHAKMMMKIPRNVKNMRLTEFRDAYGCDLLSEVDRVVVGSGGDPAAAVGGGAAAGNQHAANRPSPELETPAPCRQRTYGETPSRTIRKGAAIHSDIEGEGALVATIQKRKNTNSRDVSLDLNLGNGDYLSLNDAADLSTLDSNQKEQTLDKLQMLKAQLENAIQNLQV